MDVLTALQMLWEMARAYFTSLFSAYMGVIGARSMQDLLGNLVVLFIHHIPIFALYALAQIAKWILIFSLVIMVLVAVIRAVFLLMGVLV